MSLWVYIFKQRNTT